MIFTNCSSRYQSGTEPRSKASDSTSMFPMNRQPFGIAGPRDWGFASIISRASLLSTLRPLFSAEIGSSPMLISGTVSKLPMPSMRYLYFVSPDCLVLGQTRIPPGIYLRGLIQRSSLKRGISVVGVNEDVCVGQDHGAFPQTSPPPVRRRAGRACQDRCPASGRKNGAAFPAPDGDRLRLIRQGLCGSRD